MAPLIAAFLQQIRCERASALGGERFGSMKMISQFGRRCVWPFLCQSGWFSVFLCAETPFVCNHFEM